MESWVGELAGGAHAVDWLTTREVSATVGGDA
jgi:hypothetical protein